MVRVRATHVRILPRTSPPTSLACTSEMMNRMIFVVDALGQPLMPMAPAYARRLMRQGKAVLLRHHCYSILQLSHVVANPDLLPITLHVHGCQHLTKLTLVVGDGRHRSSFVIDYKTKRHYPQRYRSSWRRATRPTHRLYRTTSAWSRMPTIRQRALVVACRVIELQRYLPISRMIFFCGNT